MNRMLTAAVGAAVFCLMPPLLMSGAAAAADGSAPVDPSGEWQFSTQGAGASVPADRIIIDCRLHQGGMALTGDCEPRSYGSEVVPLTGVVTGSKVRWSYSVTSHGNSNTVEFDANVKSPTRLSGTLKLDGKPSELTGQKLGLEARLQRLEDEAEIRRRLQDYMLVLRKAEWDKYALMFSKDSEIIMDEGTRHGREDIKNLMAGASERMAKAAAGKPVRQSVDLLSDVEIRVRGDIAEASSRFTFLAENDAGQFLVRGSGLYADHWVREEGEWLMKSRRVDWDLLAGAQPKPAPAAGGK
ncbi:MAG TPA: nuclear transport factor 2 family protein [Steroidobacteraceae bacterium]|jgi:hypothetical protein